MENMVDEYYEELIKTLVEDTSHDTFILTYYL